MATTPDNLARIKLVTERYWELQGLRHVLVAVVFVVVFGGLLLTGPEPASDTLPIAVGSAILLIALGMLWLDRYYARVFGQIQPSVAARRFSVWIVPGTLLVLLWLHPVVGAPPYSLYFLGWAAFSAWIAWRDWPIRRHRLLDTAAGLGAGLIQWPASAAGQSDAGFLWGLVLMAVAAAMSGVRDHGLLEETLRPRPGSPSGA